MPHPFDPFNWRKQKIHHSPPSPRCAAPKPALGVLMKLTWLRELGWMGSWLVGELTADISGIFLKPGSERNRFKVLWPNYTSTVSWGRSTGKVNFHPVVPLLMAQEISDSPARFHDLDKVSFEGPLLFPREQKLHKPSWLSFFTLLGPKRLRKKCKPFNPAVCELFQGKWLQKILKTQQKMCLLFDVFDARI